MRISFVLLVLLPNSQRDAFGKSKILLLIKRVDRKCRLVPTGQKAGYPSKCVSSMFYFAGEKVEWAPSVRSLLGVALLSQQGNPKTIKTLRISRIHRKDVIQ